MGSTQYNLHTRSSRTMLYSKQSFNDTFEQQSKRQVHEAMDPKKIRLRESRDSETNPVTTPIILGLDITGSMQNIPHHLIKTGLPTMVSRMLELGVPAPAILFEGVGDSRSDFFPLQIGQFESGDAELDLWLTRTYIEGNGGGNRGESYLWPWYFAANHCQTDQWDKRGEKGFLFTIGDEHCHGDITASEFLSVMDIKHETTSREELYKQACEKWEVFHICIDRRDNTILNRWKELMGERCIVIDDYKTIPELIADTVAKFTKHKVTPPTAAPTSGDSDIKITL